MGHERVGILPQSRQWRTVVEELAGAAVSDAAVQRVASATLDNVRARFQQIQEDRGVQAALGYLIGLTQSHLDKPGNDVIPRVQLSADSSVLTITGELGRWVADHAESREYSALAIRAAADTIAARTREASRQGHLFSSEPHTTDIWREAASGAAFSDIARRFFASFIERYLRYFLEREASAVIPSLRDRELFEERLEAQVDALSGHAFDSTKIAQSFAAGWYNKHAADRRPDSLAVAGFLAFALGKLRAELTRQAEQAE